MESLRLMPDTVRMAHKGTKTTRWRPTFLRQWRVHAGFKTIVEAAHAMGYSDHTQLSKVETGKAKYDQELLEDAARLYKCTVEDLLTRPPSENANLFTAWPNLSAEQKASIEAAAVAMSEVSKRGR